MFSDALETPEAMREVPSSPGLLLRAGASRYRVLGAPGSEIARCPPLATVPDAPHWLLGVGLHKNEALPVVHLQALLDGPSSSTTDAAQVLITRGTEPPVAWLVDDVAPDDGRAEALDLHLPGICRVLIAHAFLAIRMK